MTKKLSFKEAAKYILEKADAPLSTKEIADIALRDDMLDTQGQTPEATMAAQIYVDIKKNKHSPFKKVGRGKFSLRERTESASSAQMIIEKQNDLVRTALRKRLGEMDAYQFEFLVADLLQKIGYENVEVTKRSGDKGIDVIADLTLEGITDVKTVVQVKRFKDGNKVPGKTVTQLRGSAEIDQRGLIITTSDFTQDAINEAKASSKMPVSLVNGEKLIDLLLSNEVGVGKETVVLYSVDDDYFDNVEVDKVGPTSNRKNRGLWPLPGGVMAYVETLFSLLDAIADGVTKPKALIKWFITNYENVASEKTAYGYIGVPRVIGLTQLKKGQYELTETGKKVRETHNREILYEAMCDNVFGVEEIVAFLKTLKAPQKKDSIKAFLQDNLNVQWSTYAQVDFRLQWLVNLGKIKKNTEGYIAI